MSTFIVQKLLPHRPQTRYNNLMSWLRSVVRIWCGPSDRIWGGRRGL